MTSAVLSITHQSPACRTSLKCLSVFLVFRPSRTWTTSLQFSANHCTEAWWRPMRSRGQSSPRWRPMTPTRRWVSTATAAAAAQTVFALTVKIVSFARVCILKPFFSQLYYLVGLFSVSSAVVNGCLIPPAVKRKVWELLAEPFGDSLLLLGGI